MASRFKIRTAVGDDAVRIHELHTRSVRELCKDEYSDEQINGWLNHRTPDGYLPGIKAKEMFVAISAGLVVGFGHAVPGEIWAVYEAPEFSKQGVGSLILKHGIDVAQSDHQGSIYLDSTLNARGFYEKKGFVEIERALVRHGDVLLPVVKMELRYAVR
jgi:putative acetyltransferase